MASSSPPILLGTVAIEPNRWGMVRDGGAPVTVVSDWLPAIASAGFDGIELWERHATFVDAAEVQRLADDPVPVVVFNGYALWDDPDPAARDETAEWVRRFGATGVKFNVGNDPASRDAYVERLARFDSRIDAGVRLLCECHAGTLAEDPAVAAAMFDAVAGVDRLQAIVHLTRLPDDATRAFMGGLGDRVGHVHVQLPDDGPDTDTEALAADLRSGVDLLRSFGFDGSWTIEFAHGRMTDRDEPGYVLEWAARDLLALREALTS
ncbi:MAG: sugar phosphate isomerase/epimerase family protein [Actinomycetota bacterium]